MFASFPHILCQCVARSVKIRKMSENITSVFGCRSVVVLFLCNKRFKRSRGCGVPGRP